MDRILLSSPIEPRTMAVVATTVVATISLLSLARLGLYVKWSSSIPSPLKTKIPELTSEEIKRLHYRPDHFPGARDVETPVSTSLISPRR